MKPVLRSSTAPVLLFIVMVVASVYAWPRVPDSLPVQWGLSNEVTRVGGRFEALAILPLIVLAITGKYWVIPRLHKDSQEENKGTFSAIRLFLVVGFAVLHLGVVAFYLGYDLSPTRVISLALGIIFVGMGNVFPRLSSNVFVGLRLPWLMQSERAWRAGQRLAGWSYVVSGLIMLTGSLFKNVNQFFAIGIGLLFVGLLGMSVYTFFVWRNERQQVIEK